MGDPISKQSSHAPWKWDFIWKPIMDMDPASHTPMSPRGQRWRRPACRATMPSRVRMVYMVKCCDGGACGVGGWCGSEGGVGWGWGLVWVGRWV
jgi:hypothetical protein